LLPSLCGGLVLAGGGRQPGGRGRGCLGGDLDRAVYHGGDGRHGAGPRGRDDGRLRVLEEPADGLPVRFMPELTGELEDPSGTSRWHPDAPPPPLYLSVPVLGPRGGSPQYRQRAHAQKLHGLRLWRDQPVVYRHRYASTATNSTSPAGSTRAGGPNTQDRTAAGRGKLHRSQNFPMMDRRMLGDSAFDFA
ncbi:hypothetical protein GW17_00056858, partial [Ensete ventricosum]